MKKSFVKISICISLLFMAVSAAYSQTVPKKVAEGNEEWRYLQKAKDAFVANDFGGAIQLAEKAKEIRRQDAEWKEYTLETSLKKARVVRAGDELDRVVPVLKSLQLRETLNTVNFFTERYGLEFFNNSYSKIFEFISTYSHYPEADYLLGKIYAVQGENTVALKFLQDAYEYSINLNVPMEKIDLLYDLAFLSQDLGNDNDYETYLLLVAENNMFFRDSRYMDSLLRITNSGKKDSVEKFFILYRCEKDNSLKSFIELAEFYIERGESEKALKCYALASVISITKIESVLLDRVNEYEYTTFDDALRQCRKFPDVVKWGNENKIWELFCRFADASVSAGKISFGTNLYKVLSEAEPEDYWQLYAKNKLDVSKTSD